MSSPAIETSKTNVFNKIGQWFSSNKETNGLRLIIEIILIILSAVVSSFFSADKVSKNFTTQINEVKQELNNVIKTEVNVNNGSDNGNGFIEKVNAEESEKMTSNLNNWVFYKNIEPDENGYYCPKQPGFPDWVLWTKGKYKADQELDVVFSLLDKTKNNKNPTLMVSYGDKTNPSPIVYYRLNVLDGDLNTIRLYDGKKNIVIEERSVEDVSTDGFITLKIEPVFSGKSSSRLILNPSISRIVDGRQESFSPKKSFEISLPLSNDQQGEGFQYAIGVSKGDCFKIMSTNL